MTDSEAEKGRAASDVAARVAGDDARVLSLATSLYRDEMRRAMAWRDRLDRTTNWAVVLTATILTWSFSTTDHPHYLLLVAELAVALFAVIEARRYRIYDVWRSRIRLLEANLFANVFEADGVEESDWRRMMSRDLRQPAVKMPWIEAVQRRLRRVYFPLLAIVGLAWWLRIAAFPREGTLAVVASIGRVDGRVVMATVALLHLAIVVLVVWPLERRAKGGLRNREEADGRWNE